MNPKACLLLAASLVTGMAHATCYSIYKADGSLLQQSSTTPVNLALQIGDTVREKFGPGTTMIVSADDVYCRGASERQAAPKSLADAVRQEQAKSELQGKKPAPAEEGTKTAANPLKM